MKSDDLIKKMEELTAGFEAKRNAALKKMDSLNDELLALNEEQSNQINKMMTEFDEASKKEREEAQNMPIELPVKDKKPKK